jgi:hypothetical protein
MIEFSFSRRGALSFVQYAISGHALFGIWSVASVLHVSASSIWNDTSQA